MLASQNIWLLYPFTSGSNQYSKLICVQSCIYTFLLLIQISCSAIWKSLCFLSLRRDGDRHPESDCCTLSLGALGVGIKGSKALCGCESWILPQGKKLWGGETKAKSEHRLHQNETGSSAHGGWGKGRCCRLQGSCSALPASLASSLASDFYFLLRSQEGWDTKVQWRAGLRITSLSGCDDLRSWCC